MDKNIIELNSKSNKIVTDAIIDVYREIKNMIFEEGQNVLEVEISISKIEDIKDGIISKIYDEGNNNLYIDKTSAIFILFKNKLLAKLENIENNCNDNLLCVYLESKIVIIKDYLANDKVRKIKK